MMFESLTYQYLHQEIASSALFGNVEFLGGLNGKNSAAQSQISGCFTFEPVTNLAAMSERYVMSV